jgi:hypothetical protein
MHFRTGNRINLQTQKIGAYSTGIAPRRAPMTADTQISHGKPTTSLA